MAATPSTRPSRWPRCRGLPCPASAASVVTRFAVVREPDGRVWTVCGQRLSGPTAATSAFYRRAGLDDAADRRRTVGLGAGRGRRNRRASPCRSNARARELWSPAISAASTGCRARSRPARTSSAHASGPGARPWRPSSVPAGRPGARSRSTPRSARAGRDALPAVAKAPESFYDGVLAEQAVSWLTGSGAPFSGEEWSASRGGAAREPAISQRYADLTLYETPLPTPGWMVLQQAALCEGVLAGQACSMPTSVHWMASAARLAFLDRWEQVRFGQRRLAGAARRGRGGERREQIAESLPARPTGLERRSATPHPPSPSTVKGVPSASSTRWRSPSAPSHRSRHRHHAQQPAGTWRVPHDGHPNQVAPRRRPLHTLNAWILTDDAGELRHVGNTPGGDGQVQWNMQVISHLVDHGLDPQRAVLGTAIHRLSRQRRRRGRLRSPSCAARQRLGETVLAGCTDRARRADCLGPWGGGGSALVISADRERGLPGRCRRPPAGRGGARCLTSSGNPAAAPNFRRCQHRAGRLRARSSTRQHRGERRYDAPTRRRADRQWTGRRDTGPSRQPAMRPNGCGERAGGRRRCRRWSHQRAGMSATDCLHRLCGGLHRPLRGRRWRVGRAALHLGARGDRRAAPSACSRCRVVPQSRSS